MTTSNSLRSRRALQAILVATGCIATATGISVAVGGTRVIPGGAPTAASNDSVTRFYAVWWAAQGPVLWRLARDIDTDHDGFRTVCSVTFLGGLARLAAARESGWPHPLFRVLTGFELLAPPVLTLWRNQLTNRVTSSA